MLNILIFRTDRIGDLIYTCPTILTIKKYFENSKITLITSDKNNEYAKTLNIFHEIIKYPKKNIFIKAKFLIDLSKKNFNYIFVLDGKERSILSTLLIKADKKIALCQKINFYYKFFNIKFIEENKKSNLSEAFQEVLYYCKINTKINNYDFISKKIDNKFSLNIPIKSYVHIHLDEKWVNSLYIKTYTDIDPNYKSFVNFLESINIKNNILITTGLNSFDLIENLKNHYLNKKSKNIFFKDNSFTSIYLVFKPSFEDLESLLRNSKILISCHGALLHASNSFNIKKIDIFEKDKKSFYSKYASHIKNYFPIYRSSFDIMKNDIFKNL